MALALLSPENRIKQGLAELGCSGRRFSAIAGVSNSRLANALDGKLEFEDEDEEAERLLEICREMKELQTAVGQVPVDWSKVDKVQTALVVSRINKILPELKQV